MSSTQSTSSSFSAAGADPGRLLFSKIAWRLMPFLFACYLVAQIDRMNVAFAKLEMLDNLGFSEAVYGVGAGVFFIGYFLFEVPSNLLLRRYGAHRWIARIMISWGAVSACMMFVQTPLQFYVMRFLLGVAEAGFFPGVIYYLTDWFTREYRARITAILMTAIAVSGVIVGPISGAILHSMGGHGGIAGWQWLFLLEGVPSVVLGVVTLFWLPPSPARATFLSQGEKQLLAARIAEERTTVDDVPVRSLLLSPRLWIFSALYASYGMSFFRLRLLAADHHQVVGSQGPTFDRAAISHSLGCRRYRHVHGRGLGGPPPEPTAGAHRAFASRSHRLGSKPGRIGQCPAFAGRAQSGDVRLDGIAAGVLESPDRRLARRRERDSDRHHHLHRQSAGPLFSLYRRLDKDGHGSYGLGNVHVRSSVPCRGDFACDSVRKQNPRCEMKSRTDSLDQGD